MILILIVIMQTEVPVIPSIRLQALGTEFIQLIDDPMTDLQIFPARLAQLERLTVYVHPELPAPGTWGTFTLSGGLFLPRTTGLNAGIWHTFDAYDYTSVDVNTDSSNSHIDSTTTVNNSGRQQPSLMLAVPFLKEGGWAALKFSYHYTYSNSDVYECNLYQDTSVTGADSSISCYDYHQNRLSGDHSPVWSMTLDQYLPLGDVASLDIAAKYDNLDTKTTNVDTTINSTMWASIHHSGITRYATYFFSDGRSMTTDQGKFIRNTVSLIGTYQRLPSWGMMRISGRFEYGFGQNEDRTTETYYDRSIYRYEYSAPDTSYVSADTQLTETSDVTEKKTDIKQFRGYLGSGLTYYSIDNLGLFAGLKIEYFRFRVSPKDIPLCDQDNFTVTVPIGFEWYPVDYFCLRYGLWCSYEYSRSESGEDLYSQNTEQRVSGNGSIGFGLKAASHLRIDFVSKSGMFSIGDDWGLDLQYAF